MSVIRRMRITALDPLFFRDGKPFTMGSDHMAKSLFPPSPGVIYGALRTLFFSQHPDVFARLEEARRKGENLFGKAGADPTASLRVRGVYVAHRDTLLLPLPADCVKEGKAKDEKASGQAEPTWILKRLSLGETTERGERDAFLPASNYPLPEVLVSPLPEDRRVEPPENAWCTAEAFVAYLAGTSRRGPVPVFLRGGDEAKALVTTEYKVGIARDPATGRVREGMLYRVGMVRLSPEVSLVVDYEVDEHQKPVSFSLPETGVLRLGGEGRLAAFVHEAPSPWPAPTVDPNAFKVVLLTPALFDNGWYPGWLDARSGYTGTFRGVKVRLLAAAIGRYVPIGGFDMARRKPKAMMRAVPAGAVYYFSVVSDEGPVDPERVREAFHHVSISDHRAEEGFGVAVVGRVHTP